MKIRKNKETKVLFPIMGDQKHMKTECSLWFWTRTFFWIFFLYSYLFYKKYKACCGDDWQNLEKIYRLDNIKHYFPDFDYLTLVT